jgi:hypothetical protein
VFRAAAEARLTSQPARSTGPGPWTARSRAGRAAGGTRCRQQRAGWTRPDHAVPTRYGVVRPVTRSLHRSPPILGDIPHLWDKDDTGCRPRPPGTQMSPGTAPGPLFRSPPGPCPRRYHQAGACRPRSACAGRCADSHRTHPPSDNFELIGL